MGAASCFSPHKTAWSVQVVSWACVNLVGSMPGSTAGRDRADVGFCRGNDDGLCGMGCCCGDGDSACLPLLVSTAGAFSWGFANTDTG